MPGANPPTTHPDDGWPFRATNNWSRDKSVVGSVDLHAHDTGKIIRHSGQGWVEVSIPRRRIGRGVVPKSYIEVGTDNKWGEWKVNVTVTLTVPKPPSVNLPTGSVLYKTVYALLHDIRASSANLEELSGRSKSLLGEHGGSNDPIKRIAGALCEGAQKAGTFNVLNKPNFTERDLFSQAKLVGAIDKRAKQIGGIYAWRHSGFKDVTHKPAIAVGSTIDFPQRKGGHATQSKTDTAPQYRAWRASTVHQMYALIELSIGRDDREEMYWIELVIFLLLDSYHPGLFAMSIEEKMREKYTTEEEDGSGNAPRNEDDPPGTTTEKVISAVTWAIIAKKLRAIMDGVRQRTGWQRRGYLGNTGLNWASPCVSSDSFECAPWYKTSIPGVVDLYRKEASKSMQRYTTKSGGAAYTIQDLLPRGPTGDGCHLGIPSTYDPETLGLTPETKVTLTVEVMKSGRHPVPYARLPEVYHYEHAELLNRVGVRLEWMDSAGVWHRLYLQCASQSGDLNPHSDGPCHAYRRTMALLLCLQREEVSPAPSWLPRYGFPSMRELHFDDFRQVLSIRELRSGRTLAPPGVVPAHHREAELMQRGALHFDEPRKSHVGHITLSEGGFPARRKCDACSMMATTEEGEYVKQDLACTESEEMPGNCKSCVDYMGGLHCSWTPGESITEDYRRAIMPRLAKPILDCHATFTGPETITLPSTGLVALSESGQRDSQAPIATGGERSSDSSDKRFSAPSGQRQTGGDGDRGATSSSHRFSAPSASLPRFSGSFDQQLRLSGSPRQHQSNVSTTVSAQQLDAWITSENINLHEQAGLIVIAKVDLHRDLSTDQGAEARATLMKLLKRARHHAETNDANQRRYEKLKADLKAADQKAGKQFEINAGFIDLTTRGRISNRVPNLMEVNDFVLRNLRGKNDGLRSLRTYLRNLGISIEANVKRQCEYLDDILVEWDPSRIDRRGDVEAVLLVSYRVSTFTDPRTLNGSQARQAVAKLQKRLRDRVTAANVADLKNQTNTSKIFKDLLDVLRRAEESADNIEARKSKK